MFNAAKELELLSVQREMHHQHTSMFVLEPTTVYHRKSINLIASSNTRGTTAM